MLIVQASVFPVNFRDTCSVLYTYPVHSPLSPTPGLFIVPPAAQDLLIPLALTLRQAAVFTLILELLRLY